MIKFKDAPIMHTLENKHGYRVLKITNEHTNGRRLDQCTPNVLLLDRGHWGVVGDNAEFTDLGIIRENCDDYLNKLEDDVLK